MNTAAMPPVCRIIAGPNGAGKTTFALRYLPQLELYAGAVDDASCFINSGPAPGIVFTQQGEQRTILDTAVFDQLLKASQP